MKSAYCAPKPSKIVNKVGWAQTNSAGFHTVKVLKILNLRQLNQVRYSISCRIMKETLKISQFYSFKFSDQRSCHIRKFWATFVCKKPKKSPPERGPLNSFSTPNCHRPTQPQLELEWLHNDLDHPTPPTHETLCCCCAAGWVTIGDSTSLLTSNRATVNVGKS